MGLWSEETIVIRRTLIMTALALAFALPATQVFADAAADARLAQRDLWDEHIFWVRNVVMATAQKNKRAATAAETQVVNNARQIADSITPFYGKQAADQLFELLKGHYGPIRQYLDSTMSGDAAKRDQAKKSLNANAGAIAKFLSGANPNLPYDAVNGLMLAHGAHHVAQIDQVKAGQYAEEAETWIAMRKHMHAVADAIAGALGKQFPEKFR
jgi:hypothetical protein